MRKKLRFVLATVLSLPSLIVFLFYLVMLGSRVLRVTPPGFVDSLFVYLAFWFLMAPAQFPVLALPIFLVVLATIAAAWVQKPKSGSVIIAMCVCTFVVALHFVVVFWAYLAGWKWDL